jgi:hypothetical protein
MTRDDARWMARWIGQLTEDQIVCALIAAGFDSTETRLYTEKLISRRDWLIRDLDLANEIPLLRPHPPAHEFDYDPKIDGPVLAMRPDGTKVFAQPGNQFIVRGHLKARP